MKNYFIKNQFFFIALLCVIIMMTSCTKVQQFSRYAPEYRHVPNYQP